MGSNIYIVCSDEARNGKTLFARLYADFLSLSGDDGLHIFDTDFPHGGLAEFFPNNCEIVDLSKTPGQVRLFDTMIAEPGRNYVVDLQDNLLDRFFNIFRDIGFDGGAAEAGIGVSVFYIVDRSPRSISEAERVRARLDESEFVLVLNEAIGTPLHEPRAASDYQDIDKDRDLVLPAFSQRALAFIENREFSFSQFIAGGFHDVPLEIRHEIWELLESLYNQRRRGAAGKVTHLI